MMIFKGLVFLGFVVTVFGVVLRAIIYVQDRHIHDGTLPDRRRI